jgi:hypothetical protein
MMKNLITLAAPPGDFLFAATLVVGQRQPFVEPWCRYQRSCDASSPAMKSRYSADAPHMAS